MHEPDSVGDRDDTVWVHNFTPLDLPSILPKPLKVANPRAERVTLVLPFSVLLVNPAALESDQDYDFLFQHVGIIFHDPNPLHSTPPWADFRLTEAPEVTDIEAALLHIMRVLRLKEQCLTLHNACAVIEARNRQLNQIGMALMSEKNLDKLLQLILDKAMALTGSDAGCLYLVENRPEGSNAGHTPPQEREKPLFELSGTLSNPTENFTPKDRTPEEIKIDPSWRQRQVRFKLTRNHSVEFHFEEILIPATRTSIIGYTLIEGKPLTIPDVYRIDEAEPFRHNHGFDQTSGYVTRSMMTLPMKDKHGQVIGAIQLINKCRYRTGPITSVAAADSQVIPYRQEDMNLSLSLASQAAVAIVNAQHDEEVKNLFEGFIKASVVAIESRDPSTSGHSHRVGVYSVRLAECVERHARGRWAGTQFSQQDLRELRYAALLHDFGKIGVREQILTKAKKLFPEELHRIHQRLDHIGTCLHWKSDRRKLGFVLDFPSADTARAFSDAEAERDRHLSEIETWKSIIGRLNEPSPLAEIDLDLLRRLVHEPFEGPEGIQLPVITSEELLRLSIPRGSLSPEERLEIESHVTHTFRFLSRIPWTRDLKNVPEIAHAHHEKLDGTGYPQHLDGREIPVASKIMSICDIYDALAAADRPYKKALPAEKALSILESEVKTGKLDAELLQVFVEAEVWKIEAV